MCCNFDFSNWVTTIVELLFLLALVITTKIQWSSVVLRTVIFAKRTGFSVFRKNYWPENYEVYFDSWAHLKILEQMLQNF